MGRAKGKCVSPRARMWEALEMPVGGEEPPAEAGGPVWERGEGEVWLRAWGLMACGLREG